MEIKRCPKCGRIIKIHCDLCGKSIFNKDKITMINKDNKNTIDICDECYKSFLNKSDK
ncbi:mszf55-1 [Clostridium botulinum]|uniref:mszf55-1 n=1 Tax=Clostridium TaxID=1485 RepID=UPI0013F94485|nr:MULTISPECIES: mszf55-1 [unclassified Clostridium]NFO86114.1 mszf55-1 [Clostridium botulinum]NFP28617.1 mszf55-1 [Clostridium botulinum]NFT07628.1 mszf55-1 [Clostridium botulinum]